MLHRVRTNAPLPANRTHPAPGACPSSSQASSILNAGGNCWKASTADHAAVLIDGAAYFAALEKALLDAQRSILILGWDFDSRILLRPDAPKEEQQTLGEFLRARVEARPDLEIHILVWSIAILHAPSAISELVTTPEWQRHPRIHLRLATDHPLYGSHHSKVVVIDGSLAFVGGIDLTVWRWDTPDHAYGDPRRRAPDGKPYQAVHDMQAALDGPAARCIHDYARSRWHAATGEVLPDLPYREMWPNDIVADWRNVSVGVARSAPAWAGSEAVCENLNLATAMLSVARRSIYIEAQYLTAPAVRDCLKRLLKRPDGPEVILLVTCKCQSFAERHVFGGNRDRILRHLKKADRYKRLRAYFPVVPGDGQEHEVVIHAKTIIVDDRLLKIGSTNLNNRSIGLDTECDVLIEARDEASSAAIANIRTRLLAEHLGATPEKVTAAIAQYGSIRGAIDALNTGQRRLKPFAIPNFAIKGSVWGTSLVDPIGPLPGLARLARDAFGLLRRLVRRRPTRPLHKF